MGRAPGYEARGPGGKEAVGFRPDPLLRRSVCAAGQPARPQVSQCVRLSGSDREFPGLTGRSGTQRARRPPSRTTLRTSTPRSSPCCLHLLPSDLGVLACMPAAQLDPAHETGARPFKRDRSCWKSGLRSARFTNAHCGRPSAPPRKMAADPVQRPDRARSHVGVLASYLDYAPAVAGL